MRSHIYSLLIGTLITITVTYFAYAYIERQSRNDYVKEASRFYESLEVIQSRIDDLKMVSRPYRKSKAPIALVAIDDASIEEIGRWPWSRATVAEFSEKILASGARTLTYDIQFSEAERENPQADELLGKTVEKHAEQMVLGTSSSGQYPAQTHPYQDICTTEAFLYQGGDKIVTLNPTFVVDDQSENFDSYKWKELFESIFGALSENVEKHFLQNMSVMNVSQLTPYQKNSLQSQKNKAVYTYCYSWLTSDDLFLQKNLFEQIKPQYEAAFDQKLDAPGFAALVEKIKKMKAHPIPQFLGWFSNTAPIQNNSRYTAAFNTKMDSDGFIRRYPLFYRVGSKIGSSYIPSLALQTYLTAQNYRAEVGILESPEKAAKTLTHVKIFDADNDKEPLYSVPVDSFSQIRLNYYGPEKSFYYVSAKELLTKNQDLIEVTLRNENDFSTTLVDKKEFFKDRSVLVGATALGIYDVRNTPVQNALPGPEIQMTALSNLFERNFILDVPDAQILIPALTLVLGLIATALWTWGSALISIFIFSGSLVALIFVDYLIFAKKNYMITNWPLFTVFTLSFIAISLYKYFSEERNKTRIRQAFSKYVSATVVEELLKSEKNLELGGQKKNLTVLFSDLRGFTTFSEKLEPKQLADFLNKYLTRMTEEIYKTNGTVDKFIGDAIMAFYNAPVPYHDHPQQACRCALRSIRKLEFLNDELKGQDFPKLAMGIGINTGDMSVGNMGSVNIQNYTVMGDAVNLASRLEGLTRVYGNDIILGPMTYEAVKNEFTCREIDRVVVKGKTNEISIYDLVYEGPVKEKDAQWLNQFHLGRKHFNEGDFVLARQAFDEGLRQQPSDKICAYYVKKCQEFIENPPTDWTGVNHLREK